MGVLYQGFERSFRNLRHFTKPCTGFLFSKAPTQIYSHQKYGVHDETSKDFFGKTNNLANSKSLVDVCLEAPEENSKFLVDVNLQAPALYQEESYPQDLLPSHKAKRRERVLHEKIYFTKDLKELFYYHNTFKDIFTPDHAVVSFLVISKMIKFGSLQTDDLKCKPEFEYLCKYLYKNCRSMETHQVVSLFCSLHNCQVPTNSALIQKILQVLRHSLHLLSTEEILLLERYLLKQKLCDKTPLSEALLKALPLQLDCLLKIK